MIVLLTSPLAPLLWLLSFLEGIDPWFYQHSPIKFVWSCENIVPHWLFSSNKSWNMNIIVSFYEGPIRSLLISPGRILGFKNNKWKRKNTADFMCLACCIWNFYICGWVACEMSLLKQMIFSGTRGQSWVTSNLVFQFGGWCLLPMIGIVEPLWGSELKQ